MSPRPPFWFRIGHLTPLAATLLAGSAVTVASLSSFGLFSARGMLEAPTATELDATLARVGVNAASLTAAGCSTVDAAAVAGDAKTYLDAARWAALESADEAVRQAQAEVDRLGGLVRAGQATGEDQTDYATAKSSLAAAEGTRDGLLEDFFEAATADLGAGPLALLADMHSQADRPVALKYKVASRSDAEWTSLRDALSNLKTAAMCGEGADNACSQLVDSVDAEPAVTSAQLRLDENYDEVASAYAAALGYQ